jgi:hypothetical protein
MSRTKTQLQFREYKKRIQTREKYINQVIKLDSIPKSSRGLHHQNYRLFLLEKIRRLNNHIGFRSRRDSFLSNEYVF